MERGLGYHCVDENSGSRDACGNDPRSGSIRTAFAFSLRKRPVRTQETWPILHSSRDTLQTIHLDNYYYTYNLPAGYLALLDDTLVKNPTSKLWNGFIGFS